MDNIAISKLAFAKMFGEVVSEGKLVLLFWGGNNIDITPGTEYNIMTVLSDADEVTNVFADDRGFIRKTELGTWVPRNELNSLGE